MRAHDRAASPPASAPLRLLFPAMVTVLLWSKARVTRSERYRTHLGGEEGGGQGERAGSGVRGTGVAWEGALAGAVGGGSWGCNQCHNEGSLVAAGLGHAQAAKRSHQP